MKKIVAILMAVAAVIGLGLWMAPNASAANPEVGIYAQTFRVVDDNTVSCRIEYGVYYRNVNTGDGVPLGWSVQVRGGTCNSYPDGLAIDAISLKLETTPDTYTKVTPYWQIGGSSTTHNDTYPDSVNITANTGFITFSPTDRPAFRFDFYGVDNAGDGRISDYGALS